MDAFSYLSVLLSIILGLAITQVLQGVRGLMLARRHLTFYAPTLIWAGIILLFAVQSWWASFGLADHQEWTFAEFSIVLLQTVLLYMLAGLVLPDVPADSPTDLRAHYFREARPFFGIATVILLVSLMKDLLIDGHLPGIGNVAFHGVFASGWLVAAATRRPIVHLAVAYGTAAILIVYIVVLFTRLG